MSLAQTNETTGRRSNDWLRALGVGLLLLIELFALDALYDVRLIAGGPAGALWLALNQGVKLAAFGAVYTVAALALMLWPQRAALLDGWRHRGPAPHAVLGFAVNLSLFAALLVGAFALRANGDGAPWLGFAVWIMGVAMLPLPLFAVLAPVGFWRASFMAQRARLMAAVGIGVAISATTMLAQNSWSVLAGATLKLSYFFLTLVEPGAHIDVAQRLIGAGDFEVIVDQYCSGYEGVALVLCALALYVGLFRKHLRFPHVLALFPIGAAAIWVLNSVRIAGLILIGEHVSPDLALGGFHSQAGWLMFAAVSIAMMAWAHQAAFFRADGVRAPRAAAAPVTLAMALIAPFAALMAARAVGSLFGADAYWIGAVSIVLPMAVLWFYRDALRPAFNAPPLEAWGVGLLVGAAWIATEPQGETDVLGVWLAAQPTLEGYVWLALRIFGFALIVPIAEELMFRGYLHRALARRRFEDAAPAAFSWLSFVATSVLFGALHGRWLAGMLAGAVFAIVLYRSKSVSGPIATHVAANGLIAAYAVLFGAYGML